MMKLTSRQKEQITTSVLRRAQVPGKLLHSIEDQGKETGYEAFVEKVRQEVEAVFARYTSGAKEISRVAMKEFDADSYSSSHYQWATTAESYSLDEDSLVIQNSAYVAPVARTLIGMGDLSQPMTYADYLDGLAVLAYVPAADWYEALIDADTGLVVEDCEESNDPFVGSRLAVDSDTCYEYSPVAREDTKTLVAVY